MTGFALLPLAFASLKNRAGTVMLTLLTIALSVTLFLGVEKLREGTRASFETTISDTDLIVGARSAPVNLLLASVFRLGDPPANISWETVEALDARSDIAWIIPLSLGDSHRGERVLGTVEDYFNRYKYGDGQSLEFAAGEKFDDLFDVVLGAETARLLGYVIGDEIELTHGLGEEGISDHEHREFSVKGILKPTGTPVDRTVHVSLEAISAIHVGWETGARSRLATEITDDELRERENHTESVSALMVGLTNRASILRTKRAIDTYTDEALLAVLPGQALGQLWTMTGFAERSLSAISAFVILVGLVSALASLLSGLNARRREMAILRSVGARPSHIGGLLVLEAFLMGFAGAVVGGVLVYAGLALASPILAERLGIVLSGIGPGALDVYVVAIVSGLSALMGLVPAIMAYRHTLSDGLNVKI